MTDVRTDDVAAVCAAGGLYGHGTKIEVVFGCRGYAMVNRGKASVRMYGRMVCSPSSGLASFEPMEPCPDGWTATDAQTCKVLGLEPLDSDFCENGWCKTVPLNLTAPPNWWGLPGCPECAERERAGNDDPCRGCPNMDCHDTMCPYNADRDATYCDDEY